jgi:spermidine synthase
MIGLGGGSAQRSFLHYYPQVRVDSVEIDPVVVGVATNFFGVHEGDRHRLHVADGRVYLRRARERYDLIAMDAYVKHRYGSSIPPHLVTREFMELARDRLNPHGVLAYNVIGTTHGWQSGIVGALARTLLEVFPWVYYAPASDSLNVVLFATLAPEPKTAADQHLRALRLMRSEVVRLPEFRRHVVALRRVPRPDGIQAPVLTDDYAPVESLSRSSGE